MNALVVQLYKWLCIFEYSDTGAIKSTSYCIEIWCQFPETIPRATVPFLYKLYVCQGYWTFFPERNLRLCLTWTKSSFELVLFSGGHYLAQHFSLHPFWHCMTFVV